MSWHNDTCPSFGLEIPGDPDTEPRYIRVFVDYLDKAKSEHPDDPRFLAVADTEQLASDDWQDVTAWLKAQIACLQPESSESTAHHPAH
ncbi:MAG: hypothetical protein K2X55_24435 [Burkholderiaceae bacterium]|nr:hypothetical protein [Burkholderiaceae bacterium]